MKFLIIALIIIFQQYIRIIYLNNHFALDYNQLLNNIAFLTLIYKKFAQINTNIALSII